MKDYEANRLIDEYLGKDDEGVIKNPKKQVEIKIKKYLEEIISELPLKDKGTEYILKTYNGWGDDPAKYIGIIKKASKGFFRLSKKEKLAFVRIASYYDSRYSIQINCFDPYIEEVAVQKLIELNENEFNCKGVHVWRHNYHIKGSKNDKSNLVTITEV